MELIGEFKKIIPVAINKIKVVKKLNKKRNRSHFSTGDNGAFEISNYIKRWSFIMHESFEIINKEIKKVELNMKNYD